MATPLDPTQGELPIQTQPTSTDLPSLDPASQINVPPQTPKQKLPSISLEPQNPDRLAIDEEGDATFVFNACSGYPSGFRLVVSSKIMKYSCNVLKTMLGPTFAEGRRLASEGHVQVPLLDSTDNARGMVFFCRLLHYQIPKIGEITAQVLCELAGAADKWDCLPATSIYVSDWLLQLLKGK